MPEERVENQRFVCSNCAYEQAQSAHEHSKYHYLSIQHPRFNENSDVLLQGSESSLSLTRLMTNNAGRLSFRHKRLEYIRRPLNQHISVEKVIF